jgi:hypothetical protein
MGLVVVSGLLPSLGLLLVMIPYHPGFFYRWVPRGIPRLPLGYGNGTQG